MKKRIFPIAYMFLITFIFTSMVSAVKYFHDVRIQANEKVKAEGVILKVLDISLKKHASNQEIIKTFESRIKKTTIHGKSIFIGYDQNNEAIKGYAFPVSGPGFWGPVFGMVAVDERAEKVIGLAFYRHSETPGLGGRITEDWFQELSVVEIPPKSPFYSPGKGRNTFIWDANFMRPIRFFAKPLTIAMRSYSHIWKPLFSKSSIPNRIILKSNIKHQTST